MQKIELAKRFVVYFFYSLHYYLCYYTYIYKEKDLPDGQILFLIIAYLVWLKIMPPQLQLEQQPSVRWAHGRESKIHS